MIILVFISLGFLLIAYLASIFIVIELNKRGVEIPKTWFNVKIVYHAHQYYKITKLEDGKAGIWYHIWIISLIGALTSFTIYSFSNSSF